MCFLRSRVPFVSTLWNNAPTLVLLRNKKAASQGRMLAWQPLARSHVPTICTLGSCSHARAIGGFLFPHHTAAENPSSFLSSHRHLLPRLPPSAPSLDDSNTSSIPDQQMKLCFLLSLPPTLLPSFIVHHSLSFGPIVEHLPIFLCLAQLSASSRHTHNQVH